MVSAHFIGTFGLVLVVGNLIDRLGCLRALLGGLLLLGFSALMVVWAVESVSATAAALFGVGPDWNFSYVAATAELANKAMPVERERYSASPTSAQGFWHDFGFSSGPYPGNGWTRRTWGSEARRSCSSEPLNPESSLETYRIPLTTPQRTPDLF